MPGEHEGNTLRVRASTRGHSFSADSFGLRDFRGRGDPRLPFVPVPDLDGKEGVNGSSPLEGFTQLTITSVDLGSRRETIAEFGVEGAGSGVEGAVLDSTE